MKGILIKNNEVWYVRYDYLSPHAGISKKGTGPGVTRVFCEVNELMIHLQSDFPENVEEGQEVEFEIKNYDGFELAVLTNSHEETWDSIEQEFLNSPRRFGSSSFVWLEENFEIPRRKV